MELLKFIYRCIVLTILFYILMYIIAFILMYQKVNNIENCRANIDVFGNETKLECDEILGG